MSNQDNNENLFDINDIERILSNEIRNSFRNISSTQDNLFSSSNTYFFNYDINNQQTNENIDHQSNEINFQQTNENNIFNTNNIFESIGDINVENILNFSMIYNMVDSYYEQLDEEILNETLIESLDLQPDTVRQDECLEFTKEEYNKIEGDKFENECSICLNDYEKDSIVSATKCNHLFHHDCIKEWSHYKDSCPVCREKLKE
jgi:hypothetical protein